MPVDLASAIPASYLGIIEGEIEKGDIAIYRVDKSRLTRMTEPSKRLCSIIVLEISPKQFGFLEKMVTELMDELKTGGRLHILVRSQWAKWIVFSTIMVSSLIRLKLNKFGLKDVQAFGLFPDPYNTTLVVPLKKNICKYVLGEFVITRGHPFKRLLKKYLVRLLGSWMWRGDIVLTATNG